MEAGRTEGDGRHTPGRLPRRLPGFAKLLPLLVVAVIISTAQVCNAKSSQGDYCAPLPLPTCQEPIHQHPCTNNLCCCQRQLQACWQLQQAAQAALDVRDEFLHPRRRGRSRGRSPNAAQTQAICLSQRTFLVCIARLSRVCYAQIEFHTVQRGTERQMRRFDCGTHGPVFNCSAMPLPASRSHASVCSYAGSPVREYSFCALFGDPHLRAFDGREQTCRVLGAWPLVDNKFLTVQVTNDPVATLHGSRVTAISKLTVVIRKSGSCAANNFMTYQASSDWLPSTFDDGRTHFGAGDSVLLTEVSANRHIELYVRHADTTVIVRRAAGGQLSVALRMPDSLANSSTDGVQLCANGCPQGELIEQRMVGEDEVTQHAVKTCRDAGTVDFHFDSCVFDMVVTADRNYSMMAAHAQADTLRLAPHAAAQRNRTTLDTAYQTSKAGSGHLTARIFPLIAVIVTWLIAWSSSS